MILSLLHDILHAPPDYNVVIGQMIVESIGNLLEVGNRIMTAALVDEEPGLHVHRLLKKFLRDYSIAIVSGFEIHSSNGMLKIRSDLYSTGELPGLNLAVPNTDRHLSVYVPLTPFREHDLATARVHVIYYNNSGLFLDLLHTPTSRPQFAIGTILDNWPTGVKFDADISYQLDTPPESWNAACAAWSMVSC